MGRARLTDEEREARRKARSRHSFSDAAYQHYNPMKEGFGSAKEWIDTAEAAVAGGHQRPFTGRIEGNRTPPRLRKFLADLGLTELPETFEALKKAYRRHIMKVHPDHGGTKEATIAALEAFDRLKENY